MSMPCNCHPIQPPPPFDVPPPPDPSFVFHLLSDDPPEAFEKLHLLHSCPLQKHLFFFRSSLSRFLPLAVVAALLLFTSFSITAFVFWRKRRRTRRMGGMGEETDGREWKRKSEERKSERKAEKEEGGKKRRKARAKRRMSTLSGNTPPNAVPPPSVRLQTHFNIHFPVTSPSSDPDANFSRRSSTETVSSVPSPPQIAGDEWPFHQSATVKSAEVNIGSNASHRAPTVAFATPPRRSVALRLLPNHRLSPDFVWRSSSDCAPSNDLYEELAVTEGDIAEAPYKWRRTLTPSVSARRLPPPSSKPPPPPTEYPTDWPTSAVAYSFANENPNAEMDRQQNNQPTMKAENYTNKSRWRTSADFLDKEKESGYGTGRSGRRERNQLNATNDKKCCSSATIVQPTSFSPLSNVLIHSQPNAMSNTKKIDHISIIPNLAEEKEKCNESQPKTMTYL